MHLISRLVALAPLVALPLQASAVATIPQYVYDYGGYPCVISLGLWFMLIFDSTPGVVA